MNLEHLVPELLLPYFRQFMLLKTEEERAVFWQNASIKEQDKEALRAARSEGLLLLLEHVKDFEKRVKAAVAKH